jgi:hypothetical protein
LTQLAASGLDPAGRVKGLMLGEFSSLSFFLLGLFFLGIF